MPEVTSYTLCMSEFYIPILLVVLAAPHYGFDSFTVVVWTGGGTG